MQINENQIFCDFVKITQKHKSSHAPYSDGTHTVMNLDGEIVRQTPMWKSLKGDHGSSLQIRSDGQTVTVTGNPSRFNRSENLFGQNLDIVKCQVNKILESEGLPPFTGGKIQQLQDGSQTYSGATFQRIDMTGNFNTGSESNARAYLNHQKAQTFPKLEQTIRTNTIYYGKDSDSRTLLVYGKGRHLEKQVLKKSDEKPYIRKLINYCNENGIIRFESRYQRYLRTSNMRFYDNATHSKLSKQTRKELSIMTEQIESPDYDGIPTKVLGTLTMYMAGIDVKKRLSENTYYAHRKVLKKFGYDISAQNIHILQPKVKVITLSPAEVPDFYRHAVEL